MNHVIRNNLLSMHTCPWPSVVFQYFQQGVHQAAFWSHSTIVAVHAVCLQAPFRVMLQCAECCLESYLRQPASELRIRHLVIAAEQLAQALLYLVRGPRFWGSLHFTRMNSDSFSLKFQVVPKWTEIDVKAIK